MESTNKYITQDKCMFRDNCPKYDKHGIEACTKNDTGYCNRLFKLNNFYDKALLTDKQRLKIVLRCRQDEPDYGEFQKLTKINNDIVNFVQSGKNLYIHSLICGNGKTSWAIKLMQSYFMAVWKKANINDSLGLFINVPRFLIAKKSSFTSNNAYINMIEEQILKADLVIWDEIATKALTVYEHELLLSLINARLDAGKSNIYTSNVPIEGIESEMGQRLVSRIAHSSQDIVFNGQDKRRFEN